MWQVLLFFLLLVTARLLGIYNYYFFEEDEVSIAAGVAALVRDNVGDLYRYTPQLGYYRLIELIDIILGGEPARIPAIMKGLSAIAGAVIPVLGLFAFRRELSTSERWLAGLTLAVNPIIWKSSQYGNTAIVATALATASIILLSNRPKIIGELCAFGLFIAAVLVRADSIMLTPVAIALLYRTHDAPGLTLRRTITYGFVLVCVYLAIFLFDARLDDAFSAVSRHMGGDFKTQFWEYLLWAMSPFPLIFGIWGLRNLLDTRPVIFGSILLWIIPVMAFYFASTTTPRYFLLVAAPLSVSAGVGMVELRHQLRPWIGSGLATLTIISFALLHLVVGLGHFPGSWRTAPLFAPAIRTHDGWMPTGALIYDTYFKRGFLAQSIRNAGFGETSHPHWEGPVFREALSLLSQEQAANRTTIILLDGGYGHAFHYHAQVVGARYISRAPTDPSWPFSSETWLELDQARIMTVDIQSDHYEKLRQFDVKPGDQIWVLGETPFPDERAHAKMPAGVSLVPASSFSNRIRIFRVQKAQNPPSSWTK